MDLKLESLGNYSYSIVERICPFSIINSLLNVTEKSILRYSLVFTAETTIKTEK